MGVDPSDELFLLRFELELKFEWDDFLETSLGEKKASFCH